MFAYCCPTVLAASDNKGGMVFILFWLLFVFLPIFLSKRSKANNKQSEKNGTVPVRRNIPIKRQKMKYSHGASQLLKSTRKQNIFPIQPSASEDLKIYTLNDRFKDESSVQMEDIPVEKNENKISDIGNAFPHKNMHSEDSQKNLVVKDILVGMKSRKQIVSYIVASAILDKPKSLASEDGWRIV